MNKKMHKKSQGWETFIKWGLIIFGTFIIIAFLFYNSIPGVVTIMENFGIIDKESIKAQQEPPKIENVVPKTPEEKAAVQAFEAMAKSIEDCKAKSSDNCTCNLDVPLFSHISNIEEVDVYDKNNKKTGTQQIEVFTPFIIQFWSSSDKRYFLSYVFKGYSAYCEEKIQSSVLANHKFEGIELCTSRDLLDEDWDQGFVAEDKFNVGRERYPDWNLYFYNLAGCTFEHKYPLLGTKSQFEDERTNSTQFKLYKLDKNHVCFIIGRDGNDYGFGSGYSDSSLNRYRQKIESLSSC